MNTATEPKKKMAVSVQKFAVEILGSGCNDVLLQSVVNCRLRGRIKHIRTIVNPHGTKPETAIAPSDIIPGLPEIPGMEVHVYPASCRCEIKDPLYGDKEKCKMIQAVLKNNSLFNVGSDLDGVPPREEKLEPSRMKTLIRELLWLIDTDEARVMGGPKPVMSDVERLPGNFLLNAGSLIRNSQPQYEKDLPEYEASLDRVEST